MHPNLIRKSVVKMLYESNASHLGSNMSAVEMLVAMYESVNCDEIRDHVQNRSRLIISKGHCAAATYAVMAHFGIIPMALLETYHRDGSVLAGHVSHAVKGVEHSTGALGHGVNIAVGCALGMRSRGIDSSLVLTLLGDGEIQEGSVWEALMLAVHKKLSNIVVLIDNNKISSITNTANVIDMHPLAARFNAFGLNVEEVNGHNIEEIKEAIGSLSQLGAPGVIICNTVKGKNIPFAENDPMWHYKSLNEKQYLEAIRFLDSLEMN